MITQHIEQIPQLVKAAEAETENLPIGERLELWLAGIAREKGFAAPGKEVLWLRVVATLWLVGLLTGLLVGMLR